MGDRVYLRISLISLVVILATVPWVVWTTQRTLGSTKNKPALWVSEQFKQRREFDKFVDNFKMHSQVVISWEGCTVDDERLARFQERLESSEVTSSGDPYNEIFADVATGYTAVRELMAEPFELSRGAALWRLRRTLVGPQGKASCAVIGIARTGDELRAKAIEIILDAAEQEVKLPRDAFHMAGDIVDGVAIDAENNRSTALALPSALISLVVCWLCLRSFRLTGAVLIVAAFGEGLVLAMVNAFGIMMNAVFSVMAPLVFVLTVSAGVHLVNYFYQQRRDGSEGAVDRALRAGWVPCTLAAITTAIGLGSLLVSDIVPVRQFGMISSIGVLITTGLLFLVVPGAMAARGRHKGVPKVATQVSEGRFWGWLTRGIALSPSLLAALGILAVVGVGWGIRWIETSVSVRDLLLPDSRTVQDYHWLEGRIGPLVPIEIIVHFEADCDWDLLRRVELLGKIEDSLRGTPQSLAARGDSADADGSQSPLGDLNLLGGVTSVATFTPPIPPPGRIRRMARRTFIRNRLNDELPNFVKAHMLYMADGRQSWRVSTRAPALGDVDYGQLLEDVRNRVNPLLEEAWNEWREAKRKSDAAGESGELTESTESIEPQRISATFTGLTPLVYTAQRALLHDLTVSFLTALALVTIVMILVQRSVSAGLLAMAPNVFPSAILFGAMGWLGILVDIGTVMTASVALGIAVDGTLHFLTWYRRERREGMTPTEAVERTFRHCGVAMTQTTLICGLGLLVFTISGFLPTRKFALMMIALLTAALVGDLILLPALLMSPLGRLKSLSR